MGTNINIVLLTVVAQHSDAVVVTAALREIPCFIPVFAGAVVKQRDASRLNTPKTDGGTLRQAVENPGITVRSGPLSFGVIRVVASAVQEPAGTSGQSHSLGKHSRIEGIVAFIVDVQRDAPCGG